MNRTASQALQGVEAVLVVVDATRIGDEDRDALVGYYDGEIAWVDAQLGRLLAGLRARGLERDTLVVLTADHGEEFLDHGRLGHGRTLFEEAPDHKVTKQYRDLAEEFSRQVCFIPLRAGNRDERARASRRLEMNSSRFWSGCMSREPSAAKPVLIVSFCFNPSNASPNGLPISGSRTKRVTTIATVRINSLLSCSSARFMAASKSSLLCCPKAVRMAAT